MSIPKLIDLGQILCNPEKILCIRKVKLDTIKQDWTVVLVFEGGVQENPGILLKEVQAKLLPGDRLIAEVLT